MSELVKTLADTTLRLWQDRRLVEEDAVAAVVEGLLNVDPSQLESVIEAAEREVRSALGPLDEKKQRHVTSYFRTLRRRGRVSRAA